MSHTFFSSRAYGPKILILNILNRLLKVLIRLLHVMIHVVKIQCEFNNNNNNTLLQKLKLIYKRMNFIN